MPTGAKPTLGYPTRTAAAIALAAEGLTSGEIARRMGVSSNAVTGLLAMRRSRSAERERRRAPAAVSQSELTLNGEVLRLLRPYAAKRELPVPALALLIVEAVAEGDLVDAVLDDDAAARQAVPHRAAAILAAADPAVRDVLIRTAARHDLPVEQLVGRGQTRPVALARWAAWAALRETGLSFQAIGRQCGGFDPTTVRDGIGRHAEIRAAARGEENAHD